MPSADELLDAAGISPAGGGADALLDAAGVPKDSNATGQMAAQSAGVKPIASPPPIKINPNSNRGFSGSMPVDNTPAIPSNEETTFNQYDTPPAVAAPEASARVRGFGSTPADFDAISAAQKAIVQQKIDAVRKALGGAEFDPSVGDSSVWQRARMGMMANSTDRAKYMQDNLPPGSEVKQINVQGIGPMVVFRPPGGKAFQPIKGTTDVAGPIGDFAAAIPSVGAQVATAAATDGESLLYRLFMQAMTGAGERGGELAFNHNTGGYDSQPLSADAKDMAGAGAVAAAGELGASGLSNLVGKGGGIIEPTNVGSERLAAEKSLQEFDPNLRSLTAFQLGHPLLESKGNRLAAINPTLGNIAGEQGNTLADLIAKSVTAATGGTAPAIGDAGVKVGNVLYPGLADVVDKMKADAAAPLKDIPAVSPVVGGQAFQKGALDTKDRLASRTAAKFDQAFEAARNAPDAPNGVVPFDLSGVHSTIDDISKPIIGQGVPQTVEKEVPVMSPGGIGEPVQTGTKTETSIEPTEVKIGGLSPQIQKVVDQLRSLNPQNGVGPMTERTDAPYDALKAIRSGLSEASVYNPMAPGASRQASGQASRILDPLEQTLVNPGEGAPADFVPKMKSAQNAAKFQGKVLDNPDMQSAMHTPYPEDNMKLADPSNATFLKVAQRTMDPKYYQKFQDAYATAAIREPEKLAGLLDSYRKDPSVLERLISPENQGKLKQYGIDMENVGKSLPTKLLGNTDYNARARMAFDNASGNDLAGLVSRAGGQDSPIGMNLRGALFQNVLDNSMNDAGKLDMAKAQKAISAVLSDGRAKAVLNPEELKRLEDIRTFAGGGDALSKGLGSSIYGSEVAGGALTPTNIVLAPRQFLKALGELAEARIQNATWTSNAGTRFVFGKPGGSPSILPRAVGSGGAEYELNKSRQEPTVGK